MRLALCLTVALVAGCQEGPPKGVSVSGDTAGVFGPGVDYGALGDPTAQIVPDPPSEGQVQWLSDEGFQFESFEVDTVKTREVREWSGSEGATVVWGTSVYRR